MKEKISPFKLMKGEEIKFVEENPFARNLWLNEAEWEILKLVNSHIWISSKQICEMLKHYDAHIVKRFIKFLADNSYLRRVYFATECGGYSNFKAYCVGWRGRRELKRENIPVNRYNELEGHTPEIIKELLSANQAMLAYGFANVPCIVRKPVYTLSWILKSCFRVAGYVSTPQGQFLFNSVRTHDEEKVNEKLKRMYKTLKHKSSISAQGVDIVVIFVCDSIEQMEWLKVLVERSKLHKLNFLKLEFTYDALTNTANGLKNIVA